MPTQTLQHCNVVDMDPPIPAGEVPFTAGSPGDGMVTVTLVKPGGPEPVPVPCGAPTPVDFSGATRVTLHYEKSPDGPDSVVASW